MWRSRSISAARLVPQPGSFAVAGKPQYHKAVRTIERGRRAAIHIGQAQQRQCGCNNHHQRDSRASKRPCNRCDERSHYGYTGPCNHKLAWPCKPGHRNTALLHNTHGDSDVGALFVQQPINRLPGRASVATRSASRLPPMWHFLPGNAAGRLHARGSGAAADNAPSPSSYCLFICRRTPAQIARGAPGTTPFSLVQSSGSTRNVPLGLYASDVRNPAV